MDVTGMLSDLKAHLEHGAELLASHVPALVELAGRIEADPFVGLAISTALSPEGKAAVGDLIHRMEAYEQAHAAAAGAEAPPATPADPGGAEAPAA
jgi:hypothetical protein